MLRLLLFCALSVTGFGQAAPPSQSAPVQTADKTSPEVASHDTAATFSTKVNLVMVPVVVHDRQGHAIGNLKKEDFQLFDKGKPQIISRFSMEKAGAHAIPLEAPVGETGTDKPTAGPPPPNRFIAYLFDDLRLTFGDLAQVRIAAEKHLAESLQPADRAAIYTTSGQTMLEFTDDREKMHETLVRIQPRSRASTGIPECPDVSYYMADLIQNKNDQFALNAATSDALACGAASDPRTAQAIARAAAARILSISDLETQTTLSVLKDVIRRMGSIPGQRSLVLVSPGFLITTYRQDQIDLMDRAIRSSVTISSLDARGLYTIIPGGDASQRTVNISTSVIKSQYQRESAQAEGDTLAELADGTGGTFFHNNNDLREGFRRVAATPEFLYVLGFSPQNLKLDGTFHALKVTIKNAAGLSLQARRGYYSPKHLPDADDEAKQEIREALFSRDEMNEIPVELQTQFFKSTDENARLAVVARVDLKRLHFRKAEGRNRNTLSIVSAVFDRNGNLVNAIGKTVEMRLKDETFEARLAAGIAIKTSFDVTPGSYVIRLVVRDTEGQVMAARNGVVEIPQ